MELNIIEKNILENIYRKVSNMTSSVAANEMVIITGKTTDFSAFLGCDKLEVIYCH